LHDAEIVLWGPPPIDTNSGMERIGEPLVFLELRREGWGGGGRAPGREQHDGERLMHVCPYAGQILAQR
jgi:hypothetical protein